MPFKSLAIMTARGRGAPDLRQVILPFPLETALELRAREVARAALPEIVAGLTRTGGPMVEIG